jgi:capsular polysaccharide biosynthesis protein
MTLRDVVRRVRAADRPSVRIGPAGQLQHLPALVPRPDGRRVLILADKDQDRDVVRWLDEFAGDDILVMAREENPDWGLPERGARFERAGKFERMEFKVKWLAGIDVLVVLAPEKKASAARFNQHKLFRLLFRFVSAGGLYVLDRQSTPTPSGVLGIKRLTTLLSAFDDPEQVRQLGKSDAELVRSIGAVMLTRRQIVVTKRHTHYLKLRDTDAEAVLGRRETGLQVSRLEVLRGGGYESRAEVISHGALPSNATWPSTITHPAMSLRRYEGRLASSGAMLLFTGRSILPDSFRWHLASDPRNSRIISVSPLFARIDSQFVPERELKGSYYFLDSSNSGHFGHLTTEVVSRLWGWDRAKQDNPDLKAFFHLPSGSTHRPLLEIELFGAYGIAESDIVWTNEPVWLENVYAATPMWHNEPPYHVHPGITDTWRRMTDRLLSRAGEVPTYDRVFVSRGGRLKNRVCRNREAIEEFFADRGFHVLFPERVPLPQQAAIFANARVVAGFGGSAMFNLMHTRRLETTIVLSHNAYLARNEHLFASLLGGRLHYFWSESDIPQPDGRRSRQAFKSTWAFDFERYGAELEQVIAEA